MYCEELNSERRKNRDGLIVQGPILHPFEDVRKMSDGENHKEMSGARMSQMRTVSCKGIYRDLHLAGV